MKKDELIKKVVELNNEIYRLKRLLPNVKTDEYIKNNRVNKESFKFSYTKPSLDWYETINVEIKPDDYYYFKLERRYGPTWYLFGCNAHDMPEYHWKETEIGELSRLDLIRFIKWARALNNFGCPIIEIRVVDGTFDFFEEVKIILTVEVGEVKDNG